MTARFAALGLAALLAPAGVAAQGSGEWWAPLAERLPATEERGGLICTVAPDLPACRGDAADRDRRTKGDKGDRDDRADTRRDDGRQAARGRDGRRGNGPPFCRNGQGHPVHGRQWCRDKGFGTQAGVWRDVGWEDVILGRRDRTRDRERLDRGGLLDVLGSVVVGRLDRQARALGGGPLEGRFTEGRTTLLQIRAGELPLAELLDANGDGRVDRVLLHDGR